MVTMDRT
uniref:Uncharacterized protein n=1 Tax=Romanomermis culicivorax TaxID=13658 RepID=A0A915K3G2_ROMCU